MICPHCGSVLEEDSKFCPNCGAPAAPVPAAPQVPQAEVPFQPQANPASMPPVEIEARENVALGILGALVGALIGGASIVLLSQMGFIASVSGLLLAICTLKGYQLLGKKLSTVGIIVSVVLMVITPFLADRLSWCIAMVQEIPEIPFGESFGFFSMLLKEDPELMGAYIKDLLMLYGFVALGGVSTIVGAFKSRKK